MIKIRCCKTLICVFSFLFSLLLCSCDFGSRPDKIIEMTIELNEKHNSDKQIDLTLLKLNKRLQKIAKNAEAVVLSDKNQIKITIATNFQEERFEKYVLNPGKLDFYETYRLEDFTTFLLKVNEEAKITERVEGDPFFELIKKPGYQGGGLFCFI